MRSVNQRSAHLFAISFATIVALIKAQISRLYVYPKVSGLAALSENCKCYSSLPLDAVVSLFCESVLPPKPFVLFLNE
jgi:hypothetical protein